MPLKLPPRKATNYTIGDREVAEIVGETIEKPNKSGEGTHTRLEVVTNDGVVITLFSDQIQVAVDLWQADIGDWLQLYVVDMNRGFPKWQVVGIQQDGTKI